jgi:hypothetical protein
MALGSSPRDAISVRSVGTAPPPIVAPARPRPRTPTAPGTGPQRPDTQTTGPTTLFVAGDFPRADSQADSQTTDPTPAFHLDELGLASDTIVSIPQMPAIEPIVRFREPTMPPPSAAAVPPSRPDAPPPRLVTPATALFAEPELEPDTHAEAAQMTEQELRHASLLPITPIEGALPRRAIWRMAAILVALALVGAAVTAGALQLLRGRRSAVEVTPPAPPSSGKTDGTVEFDVTPADSAITIEGKPTHLGTPWSIALAPGVYQLEIHHDGYMGWLTSVELSAGEVHPLRIALEPLGAAGATDATLIIASPPGLEVLIDSAPGGKTPLKRALPPGPHTVVLRRNGADVWRKTLDAQANAVYELRPAVTPAERPPGPAQPPGDPPPAPPSSAAEPPGPMPGASSTSASPGAPPPDPASH